MAKSADARDLKSLGGNTVPVQVRSPAPKESERNLRSDSFFFVNKLGKFVFQAEPGHNSHTERE